MSQKMCIFAPVLHKIMLYNTPINTHLSLSETLKTKKMTVD